MGFAAIGGGGTVTSGGIIIISGGTVTASGGDFASGIGGGYKGASGTITIEGGTVHAKGGSQGGAGIGGGSDGGNGGNIKISGGTVTANGDVMGAGIGGGRGADGGNIEISGGTVTAKGGDAGIAREDCAAAGIGGGGKGSGGTITINGGTVNARGGTKYPDADNGYGGAGIGGGGKGSGGNITIGGGSVYARGGYKADGIGAGNEGRDSGRLSSGTDGQAWVMASSVGANIDNFTSGVLAGGGFFARVYGHPTITTDAELTTYRMLRIKEGQTLTIARGTTVTVAKSSEVFIAEGGKLVNEGKIVNNGTILLPVGSSREGLGDITGSGSVEAYDRPAIKDPVKAEREAIKRFVDKYLRISAMSVIAAAEEGAADGSAEMKEGDILLFGTDGADGTLRAMMVDASADQSEYAVIANGQMGDVMGDGDIVFVGRFIDPNDAEKAEDIPLDDVSVHEAGGAKLDATIVIVNGMASEEVQAMPGYRPSGLADGQGLVTYFDEQTKVNVLAIFDGNETDSSASAYIIAKEAPRHSSSGGSCASGAAALVAIAALAAMKRRIR